MITDLAAIDVAAVACAAVAGAGIVQAAAGLALLRRFRRRRTVSPAQLPPITVLKPLYGDEPLLEQALASFCEQDYPEFQLVFGAQSASDPALLAVARLRERFPHVAIDVVVDATRHGTNGKVGNLINMLAAARHDVLVVADSDVHAPRATLRAAAAALTRPGAGLATALYTGHPVGASLPSTLGAAYVNHIFISGALLARALGRQDCLGAVMALRRDTLERIGGFAALANNVADDALLGHLVRAQGLTVELIDAIPATTVAETAMQPLFQHELRWARTVRAIAPAGFALSVIQFPLFWATMAIALDGTQAWTWACLALVWSARAAIGAARNRVLPQAAPLPIWLLPVRDALSITVMGASYMSNRVLWRGQSHQVAALAQPGRG